MSKEKQIEEMALELCRPRNIVKMIHHRTCGNCDTSSCDIYELCVDLYNAGYRKQSGNVIELPCKVGDVAYVLFRGVVTQGTIRLIRPFISEQETIFKGNLICEVDNLFIDDGTKEEVELYVVFKNPYGIERVAYLNREEAEEALAKEKGGAE